MDLVTYCATVSLPRKDPEYLMNIDLHFHLIPPFFVEDLKTDNPWGKQVEIDEDGNLKLRIGRLTLPLERNHFDTQAILAAMDTMRIDVAAISPSPILFHNHLEGDVLAELYRRTNDHLIDIHNTHPDRFKPLGLVPLQSPKVAVAELNRIMDAGLSGIEIETNIAGRNLDDPGFLPVFEAAHSRSAVVFLHPLAVLGADRLRSYYLTNLIGNPTDTSVAVASLIFGGVMQRFPNLKVVLPHGGGSTPCLCGRWDHGSRVRPELDHMKTMPSEVVKKFYFDTLTHSEEALSLLINVVGTKQIVLGSDHPYDMGDLDLVSRIERRDDLNEEQKQAILGENARRLLNLI